MLIFHSYISLPEGSGIMILYNWLVVCICWDMVVNSDIYIYSGFHRL